MDISLCGYILSFFLLCIYTLLQSRTYTHGTYNPNAREPDACRWGNRLCIRKLDSYTRTGLPECVVSTMSGPPPEKTQDRTQTNIKHLVLGWKTGTLLTTPRRGTAKGYNFKNV